MDMGEEPENKDNNDKMMKETTVFGQHTDVFKESWGLSVKQTVYVNGEKTENEVVVPMEEGEDYEIVLITEVKLVKVDNVEDDILNKEQIYPKIYGEEGSNNSMGSNKDNITEEDDKHEDIDDEDIVDNKFCLELGAGPRSIKLARKSSGSSLPEFR